MFLQKNQFLPDFPPPSTRDIFPSVLCLWTTLGELKTKLSRRISSGFLINSDAVDLTAYFACFLSLLVYATVLWDCLGKFAKGVVASYQIRLNLPSVAQTHPKMYLSRCNLQYSICRHAVRKVLSLEYHHSLF